MGALAFFILMFILFFSALFFIVLNLIFIIIWKARKRKERTPKKRYLIIPVIFLIMSIMAELIPVGWVCFLRTGNNAASRDIVKAESGKIVYWGYGENGDAAIDNFKMDGITYIEAEYSGSTDTWKLGKPVANIRYESDEKRLNKFMKFLFGGDDTSTLYPIINEKGFKLYTIGSSIYCPENQKNLVMSYYNDLANYDTDNLRYESCIYKESKDKESGNDLNFIYKNITLNEGVFLKLYQSGSSRKPETIKIPDKYINILKAEKPGTPMNGYNDIILYAYSNDKVMSKQVELALINDHIYCVKETDSENITGYPLPDEINKYLMNIIFKGM